MRNILLLSIATLSFLVAGEATKEIPKDVAPVLTAYQLEAKKAWDIYQAALQKAEDKAKKDLTAKMAPALKKGDLDTANAIKIYMDKVTSGEFVTEKEVDWNAAKNDKDLLGDAKGLVIIEATWGVPGKTADVTEIIKKQVKDNKLTFVHDGEIHHGLFAQIPDPANFTVKVVTIKYSFNGKIDKVEVARFGSATIPAK